MARLAKSTLTAVGLSAVWFLHPSSQTENRPGIHAPLFSHLCSPSLLFLRGRAAVWQLLTFCLHGNPWSPAPQPQGMCITQRYQGVSHGKISTQLFSACTTLLFPLQAHLPVSPHDSSLPQHLWSWWCGWLILRCKWQDRSFQPGWEMAVVARTFVGSDFARGQLEAHLCACLVLLAAGKSRDWHKVERPDQRRQQILSFVLCPARWLSANS